jgi:hypothetical protein
MKSRAFLNGGLGGMAAGNFINFIRKIVATK